MEKILCSEGQVEFAEFYCICKFPLHAFCEKHDKEHKLKDPGFHFTLPLTAIHAIPTKQDYFQAREWLNRLNFNIASLKERLEDFAVTEEKIEATYQDVQQHAIDFRLKLKEEFAVVKTELKEAIERAVRETSSHALEQFVPTDPFSQLLWFNDPGYIAAYQIYIFEVEENLDPAYQVRLQVTMPGFQHLKVGRDIESEREREQQLLKEMALKDERSSEELEMLKKDSARMHTLNMAQAQELQELRELFKGAQSELSAPFNSATDSCPRCAGLQKEKENLEALVKIKSDKLAQCELSLAQTTEAITAQGKQLEVALKTINAQAQELQTLGKQVRERDIKLSALQIALDSAQKERADAENQHHLQKEDPSKPFNIAPRSSDADHTTSAAEKKKKQMVKARPNSPKKSEEKTTNPVKKASGKLLLNPDDEGLSASVVPEGVQE